VRSRRKCSTDLAGVWIWRTGRPGRCGRPDFEKTTSPRGSSWRWAREDSTWFAGCWRWWVIPCSTCAAFVLARCTSVAYPGEASGNFSPENSRRCVERWGWKVQLQTRVSPPIGREVGDMATTALVIVDMLVDFVEESGKLYCGPAARVIIPRIQEEARRARGKGEMVIYLCDRHRADDSEFGLFPPHAVEGTRGAEVCGELAPLPGDRVIAKRRFSGFAGTDLDLTLREQGIAGLRLTGVCTNICVLYTAADARMLGYAVDVVADAVASFDDEAHRWALRELAKTLGARMTGGETGGATQ